MNIENASKMLPSLKKIEEGRSTTRCPLHIALAVDENFDTSLERNQPTKDDSLKSDLSTSAQKSLVNSTGFNVVKHKLDQLDEFFLDQIFNVSLIRKSGRLKKNIHKPDCYK